MWIISALILHVLLLGSIFVIYFRTPVITGLTPQANLHGEPASRLVLIVTDGLRAESFFHNECEHIPALRELIIKQGILGVSHTRVPTESRPGHIALIAGLYEDPSAVTRGWKENPIDFDTVFNRSRKTYAWGAHDVLSIFSKITTDGRMVIDSYDHELDFSGKDKTYMLDTWVFERVKFLLSRKQDELQNQRNSIYFLHLLGLDSAGHIHKPGSELFIENLLSTDKGIVQIYEQFEKTFPDGRTAYLLTSDHGMTDSGSHGSGAEYETRTPLFIWGAGVKDWPLTEHPTTKATFTMNSTTIPLYEVEQAQIAPLISTLIGIAPPVNNFGILPLDVLNVSEQYAAQAMKSNSLQLLAQYEELLGQFEKGLFSQYFPNFDALSRGDIDIIKSSSDATLNESTMKRILQGIDYFQTYYKNVLLFCTTLAFVGWMVYLIQVLDNQRAKMFRLTPSLYVAFLTVIAICIFILVQNIPLAVGCYIILPVLVWTVPVQNWRGNPFKKALPNLFHLQIVIGAEIVVISFFYREFISGALMLLSLSEMKGKSRPYLWLAFSACLAAFPLFPNVNGQKNDAYLVLGILLIFLRPFVFKFKMPKMLKILSLLAIANTAICVYLNNSHIAVPRMCLLASWTLLLVFIIFPLFCSKTNRVQVVVHCLLMAYILLCTSYEAIFVVLLSSHVSVLLSKDNLNLSYQAPKETIRDSFRTSFTIIVYTFFAFFGTGNIASVSSFDPNIIRCFLSTFSPFTIMLLVIAKLVIPVVLVITIIFALTELRINERQVFICLMYICDVMGLNFLFLVRNQGSWLEIGSSISHFVIMEVTTLVLLLISMLAKLLLRAELGVFNKKTV